MAPLHRDLLRQKDQHLRLRLLEALKPHFGAPDAAFLVYRPPLLEAPLTSWPAVARKRERQTVVLIGLASWSMHLASGRLSWT